MQERLRFIEHGGCRILLEDFSSIEDDQEFVRLICEAAELVQRQPPGSMLILIDLSNTHYMPAVSQLSKNVSNNNTPFVKATAMVGVSGLMPIAVRALSTAAGRDLPTFSTRDAAMEWLVSQ